MARKRAHRGGVWFSAEVSTGDEVEQGIQSEGEGMAETAIYRPHEEINGIDETKKKKKQRKNEMSRLEKRVVAPEFLSLTAEKMVEVEKLSHFGKWLGMELNMRDLFLDHPGIFYLSTKKKRHTVFLREAYDRGCLVEPNPIYEARRRLLHLVRMGRRGAGGLVSSRRTDATVEKEEDGEGEEEEEDEDEDEEDDNMGETLE